MRGVQKDKGDHDGDSSDPERLAELNSMATLHRGVHTDPIDDCGSEPMAIRLVTFCHNDGALLGVQRSALHAELVDGVAVRTHHEDYATLGV